MNMETVLEKYNVIIKDGKIVKMGKAEKIKIPKNATVIEGSGKYLTPGLMDMHVHLWYKDDLELYLANGVTTIRDMFGNFSKLSMRSQIEKGEILGPHLYVASPIINGKTQTFDDKIVITNPEEAEKYVKEFKKLGYDFIKVYETLTRDVYDAIIETAKKENIPVVGHVPSDVGIEIVLQSRQKSIEHLDEYTDSEKLYDMTIENDVWNCPTIVAYKSLYRAWQKEKSAGVEYLNPNHLPSWEFSMAILKGLIEGYNFNELNIEGISQEKIDDYIKIFQSKVEDMKIITKNLYDNGGKILLGTDAGTEIVLPGFSIHDELYNLVEAGLTPYEAIKAGTYNAAEFLNILDVAGTVEENKNADLILLSENPLEDITNMKKIEGVMIMGRWISKSEIDDMLNSRLRKYER